MTTLIGTGQQIRDIAPEEPLMLAPNVGEGQIHDILTGHIVLSIVMSPDYLPKYLDNEKIPPERKNQIISDARLNLGAIEADLVGHYPGQISAVEVGRTCLRLIGASDERYPEDALFIAHLKTKRDSKL